MSIYANTVSSGMDAMFGISADRAYTQTYNQIYSQEMQKYNAAEGVHTAQMNIAAINQDQVTTNTTIRANQANAAAQAKVSAATAGVQGGSVDDIMYGTEANEAYAFQANQEKTDQAVQNQLTQIGTQSGVMLSVDESVQKPSYLDGVMNTFSSLSTDEISSMGNMFGSSQPDTTSYSEQNQPSIGFDWGN